MNQDTPGAASHDSPTDQSEYGLARPERFPDGPATNAATSATVEDVLLRSNGSWKTPPTARDLEDALKDVETSTTTCSCWASSWRTPRSRT